MNPSLAEIQPFRSRGQAQTCYPDLNCSLERNNSSISKSLLQAAIRFVRHRYPVLPLRALKVDPFKIERTLVVDMR